MRDTDCPKKGNMPTYLETFDSDPGGWFGWISNTQGPRPLEIRQSCAISQSPWWIDYNHAPPGAGYLHLLYMLFTAGVAGEHQHETARSKQVHHGWSRDRLHTRSDHTASERRSHDARRTAEFALPGGSRGNLYGLVTDRAGFHSDP